MVEIKVFNLEIYDSNLAFMTPWTSVINYFCNLSSFRFNIAGLEKILGRQLFTAEERENTEKMAPLICVKNILQALIKNNLISKDWGDFYDWALEMKDANKMHFLYCGFDSCRLGIFLTYGHHNADISQYDINAILYELKIRCSEVLWATWYLDKAAEYCGKNEQTIAVYKPEFFRPLASDPEVQKLKNKSPPDYTAIAAYAWVPKNRNIDWKEAVECCIRFVRNAKRT